MDLIEVVWLDHCSMDAWTDIASIDSDLNLAEVTTVGFLIKETKSALYVSSSIDSKNDNACQTMCIIKKVISKRKVIKIGKSI